MNACMRWHARFWAKVEKTDGCWLWTASTSEGYGQLTVERRNARAHVLSWEMHFGPVPPGLCVCHTCDDRRCVRPDHLFLGTRAQNLADMRAKGRHARGEAVANRGSANGNARLDERTVKRIKVRIGHGDRQTAIAEAFGVSQATISLIALGKVWANV